MIRRLLLSAVALAFAFCAAPATSQTLTATNGSGPVACVNVTIASGETRCVQAGVPLKGTANTLVELVTLTASVTGAGYCNVQGYTAI